MERGEPRRGETGKIKVRELCVQTCININTTGSGIFHWVFLTRYDTQGW